MVNIAFDVPKDMLSVAQNPDIKNKPYDLCLKCPFMRESCDGPNVLAMEYHRWVEWANARAKQMGLTRADISELSMVPIGTVTSALSERTADIRTATMRDITKVLIGGCWGKYPCHFAALLLNGELKEGNTELQHANQEIEMLRERLQAADDRLAASVTGTKKEDQKKIDYLKQEIKELKQGNTIRSIIIGVLVTLLFALLAFDFLVPTFGLFRG